MATHCTWKLALAVAGHAALGCSAPTANSPPVNCGRGALVEHEGRVYCVYVGEGIEGYECPDDLDARVETSGTIVCAMDAVPDDVCRELGVGCPPPETCPASGAFDGHQREIVMASDGRTSSVSEPFVLQHQESWSRSGDTMFFEGDHLWWPRTQDQCPGMSPEGRSSWWGVKTTSIVTDEAGFPIRAQTTCVPDTYRGASLVAVRSAGHTLGCWLGHHPTFGVHCGPLGHGWMTPTYELPEMQGQLIGADASGALVYAYRREPPTAFLQRIDPTGIPAGPAVPVPLESGLAAIAPVGDEWWLVSVTTDPGPTARVTPFDRGLVPGEPFELRLPHRTAQMLGLNSLGADTADALHALVVSGAPEEPGRLAYLLIRPDRTFASRLILENASEDSIRALYPQDAGSAFTAVATSTSSATGESIVRFLRLDCEGRLLEPPLDILHGAGVYARAMVTSGDVTWVITSAGPSDPGSENVLHTIRTR